MQPSLRHRQRPRRVYAPFFQPVQTIRSTDWLHGRRPHAQRTPAISGAELDAWTTGVRALGHLQRCFPKVAAQVAALPLTPGRLVHIAQGLLGLVSDRMTLYMSYELDMPALVDPTAFVSAPLDVDRSEHFYLAQLDALAWDLQSLTPEGYGVGMSLFFDEATDEPDLLTLAIWRLLQYSEWSVGIDLADVLDGHTHGPLIMGLAPLYPLQGGIEPFLETLTFPRWPYRTPPGTLIAYAVERTDNPLANILNSGVGEPISLDWSELPDLFPLIGEARQIARDYQNWVQLVNSDPKRHIRLLQRRLYKAAWPYLPPEPYGHRTLSEILTPS